MSVLTFERTGKLKPPHWYNERGGGEGGGGGLQPLPEFCCVTIFRKYLIDSLSCSLQVKVNIMGNGAAGGP